MVIKAKKGLYDNLSRKELKSMCSLYGLPPNKKSLVAFFEKASHSNAQRKSSCLSFSKEDVFKFRPQNESSRSSTFQLYVRSEDGLNLYVDLNSSLSDWTKSFKREIHILENVHDDLACPKDDENELDGNVVFENIDQDRPEMMSLDPLSVDFCPVDPPGDDIIVNSGIMQNEDSILPNPRFDASGLNCYYGEPDNKETEKSGLTNLSESNHLPISAQVRERSNILNERESSECSEFTKTSEKACFDSGNLNSNGGHQKKRKRVESEHQSDYAQPSVKILRSMKRKKDLPRRSMRLMSK